MKSSFTSLAIPIEIMTLPYMTVKKQLLHI